MERKLLLSTRLMYAIVYRYGMPIVSLALMSFLGRVGFPDFQESQFHLLGLAILISSWYGGIGPGIVALCGAVVLRETCASPPLETRFTGFVIGFGILLIVGTLKHLVQDAEAQNNELRLALKRFVNLQTAELARANEDLSRECTGRAVAEEVLRLRERALEALIQGVCIVDPNQPDCPIIYVNRGFEQLTGYRRSEVIGQNCRFLQGPETSRAQLDEIRKAVQEQRGCIVELINYRKDGTAFWNALSISPIFDSNGRVSHYVGVQTDISAAKKIEAQLYQSQKMEAVGHLAGGIAHDFNNLLTVINGYCEIVKDSLTADDSNLPLIEEIHKAGERAATLTRQLLAFSRKSVQKLSQVDLNYLVTDMHRLLCRLIGEDIQLDTVLAPDLGRVNVDPGQMEQILMNLTVNARDAMPKGGRIILETRNRVVDEMTCRSQPGWKPGEYVTLAITDTGCGMDKQTLARIFEPFFTTKGPGKGTGLGLATVYGIVQQSNGAIHVDSEVGKGTTITIYLPVADSTKPFGYSQQPVASQRVCAGETVLLVEDEDGVRALTRQALERDGYNVLEANNGEEALRLCEEHPEAIPLLLTDVVMPQMSGRDLVSQISKLHPEIKVLYMSGYTDDAMLRHGILEAETDFLQKPFTMNELLNKVRDVLDGQPMQVA